MVTAVVSIHVIVCVALCVVVLLQQGKGADIGAVFGGSSQTVFGASGAGNALTKTTWALAVLFFASSMFLAFASARRVSGSIFDRPFSSAPSSVMQKKQLAPKAAATSAAPISAAPAPVSPAAPPAQKK